ncbi:MAG: hypothetical protein F4X54_09985 [Chloroflexi bacterium]|nr:hypothetical protein [Chloroflexota bacterium]MYB85044.1 hypothetical protein [Chloroflexota bacterium]
MSGSLSTGSGVGVGSGIGVAVGSGATVGVAVGVAVGAGVGVGVGCEQAASAVRATNTHRVTMRVEKCRTGKVTPFMWSSLIASRPDACS